MSAFTGTLDKCKACDKTVYFVDLLSADGATHHKSCFKCSHCKGTLVMSSYSSMDGVLYCKPHFEQLFKESGNFSKNFHTSFSFHSPENKYHPLYKDLVEDATKRFNVGTESGLPVQVDEISDWGVIQNTVESNKSGKKCRPKRSEVACEYGLRSGRVSRNSMLNGKSRKLDCKKFEFLLGKLQERFSEDIAFLDSLWFSIYINGHLKAKVLGWIKKKDIFSKKYVFMPIVIWGHWSLLILCHFGEAPDAKNLYRGMLLLDSLRNPNLERLKSGIRRFVLDIFKSENRMDEPDLIRKIPLLTPKVPQQKGGTECGIFVLYYIYLFLQSAPDKFTTEGYPYFMKQDWFRHEEVECFGRELEMYDKEYDASS